MEDKLENKIDDLTEAVAAGFTNLENSLGGKLEALENKVDVRTNAITKRLDVITDDLRVIKTTLPNHAHRIEHLEKAAGFPSAEESIEI